MEQLSEILPQGVFGWLENCVGLSTITSNLHTRFRKFNHNVQIFELNHNKSFQFLLSYSPEKYVCLIVYVHDIVITWNNTTKISQIK